MAAKKSKSDVVVYIGPDIGGKVKSGTAFKNGISQALIDEIKSNKLISKLIVGIDDLAKSMNEVNTEGTLLNIVYKEVLGGMN